MPFFGGAQGALDFRKEELNRAYMGQMMQQMQQKRAIDMMAMQQAQRQQAARGPAFDLLARMFSGAEGGGAEIPPPPGTGGGPQPPAPGQASVPTQATASAPQMMPGGPQGTPGPMAGPESGPIIIPPYRALPQPSVGEESSGPGDEIPSPPEAQGPAAGPAPAQAAAGAAAPGAPRPGERKFSLPGMVKGLKSMGVPNDQAMDMLEVLTPIMTSQNRDELNLLRVHNKALTDAQNLYVKMMSEATKSRRVDVQETEVENKDRERTRQNDIRESSLKQKLHRQVGGPDNLRRTDFEKDGEGRTIGVVGITKSGKIVRLDMEGNPRGASAEGPKSGANRVRDIGALQRELNGLIALPSPTPTDKTRMEELKKEIAGRNKQAGPAAAPGAGGGGLEAQARDAIARGADAAAVRARYKQQTGKDLP